MKKKRSNVSLFNVILQTILAVLSVVKVVRGFVDKSYDESVFYFVMDIVYTVGFIFLSVDGFIRLRRSKKEEETAADSADENKET